VSARAAPDTVAGAHYGDSMVIYVAGRDPRRGNAPFLAVEPTPGGWGAFEGGAGLLMVVKEGRVVRELAHLAP
jgi:N-methylhydantoinase B/oxoprolinase/acetone carboxylase alpha subunit